MRRASSSTRAWSARSAASPAASGRARPRCRAWALTLGLAAFLILSTAATVALNHWNRWFFDSLEARDVEALTQAVFVFALIIAAMAAIGVGIVLTRETLQVRWRAWLVEHLVDRWLGRQRFYHLNVTGKEPPNPEYRISDDTRWATEPLVDLGIGLLLAVVGAAAFISILWTRRRLAHARPGLRRHLHHPRLHGDRGAGLRLSSPRA